MRKSANKFPRTSRKRKRFWSQRSHKNKTELSQNQVGDGTWTRTYKYIGPSIQRVYQFRHALLLGVKKNEDLQKELKLKNLKSTTVGQLQKIK